MDRIEHLTGCIESAFSEYFDNERSYEDWRELGQQIEILSGELQGIVDDLETRGIAE